MFTLNTQLSILSLLLLFLLPAARVRADVPHNEAKPELRAFWADGFNEGYKTPEQIDTLLKRLHDAHCNAVFAQMRKGGDAYYASHYEPWASDDSGHFDALACLIDRARRMQPRIAVHAWINTCAVGTGTKHPGFHIAQLHPEWMSVNARGRADDGEVRKIDPGNPDAADWTFRLYLDVVRHYDVDGIHFDFVRYGSPRFGYNPVSVHRFQAAARSSAAKRVSLRNSQPVSASTPTAPQETSETETSLGLPLPAYNDPAWKQWRRDQVTALVRKVYVHAVALKPQIVVSAATIAWGNGPRNEAEWQQKSAAMNRVFQDWRGWLQEGIVDLACPMTYFGGRHGLAYERTWSDWIKAHQYERAATVAVGNWQLIPEQTLAQMRIARAPDAQGDTPYGVVLYSYAGTNLGAKPGKPGLHELELQPDFYAMLGQPSAYSATPPFATDTVPPPMPWKTQAAKGILKGFVRDTNLQPADGVRITIQSTRSGRQWTRQTDGTGFYAFVNLPPDTYTIRASTSNETKIISTEPQQTVVQSGKVATYPIDLPSIVPPASEVHLRTRLRNAVVVLGTDTYPGNLYVRDPNDKIGLCQHIRLSKPPAIPFQSGDIVDIVGVPATIDGENSLDDANACLNDIAPGTDTAPISAVSVSELGSKIPVGGFARIRGKVTQADADGFTLTAEKPNDTSRDTKSTAQVRVPLAGRKDYGVEASAWTALQPRVGSIMEVTGLLTSGVQATNGIRQFRLLPRNSADVTLIAPPPAPITQRGLSAIVGLLALLILFLWFGRKHLQRLYARLKKQR